jgi:Ca2+-binding EF-hand superfamily protein
MIGDVDKDGQIAATDIADMMNQILENGELTAAEEYIYDTNADGMVNLVDLVRLKKYLAGKSKVLGDETSYATVFAAEVVAYEDRKDN